MTDREETTALKQKYGTLYDKLLSCLYKHDIVGLADCGAPLDEYAPELSTILPRLPSCHSAADVHKVLLDEYARWFSPRHVEKPDRFQLLAEELWAMWQSHPVGLPLTI